jgi:hypothetical protein
MTADGDTRKNTTITPRVPRVCAKRDGRCVDIFTDLGE